MISPPIEIVTERLCLRQWREDDRSDFTALHADADVMEDLGGPLRRTEVDQKFDHYRSFWEEHGYGKWAVCLNEKLLGYTGVKAVGDIEALGPHDEIGWRLHRMAWGCGFATEAAQAALRDVFDRIGLREVLAYTGPANVRSQSVMRRLNLKRDPSRDFSIPDHKLGEWHGIVWGANAEDWK